MANDTKNNQENNQEIDFSKIDFDALEEEAMDHYEEQQKDSNVEWIDEEEVTSNNKKKDEEKEEEPIAKKSKDEEIEQPKTKSKDDEEVKQETKQEEKNNERKEEKMEEKESKNIKEEEVKHIQKDENNQELLSDNDKPEPLIKMVIDQPRLWTNAFLKSGIDKKFEQLCQERKIKCRMGEGENKGKIILENVDTVNDFPALMESKKFRKFLSMEKDKSGNETKLSNVKIFYQGSKEEITDKTIYGNSLKVFNDIRKDTEARKKSTGIDLTKEKTLKKNSEEVEEIYQGKSYEVPRCKAAKAAKDFFETQASKGNPAKQVAMNLFAGFFSSLADAEPSTKTVYPPNYIASKGTTQANDKYVEGMVEAMVGTTENPYGAINDHMQMTIGQMILDGDLKINKQNKIEHTRASKKAMKLMDESARKDFQMNINFLNAWGDNAEIELAKYGQDNAKIVKDKIASNLGIMNNDQARFIMMNEKDKKNHFRDDIANSINNSMQEARKENGTVKGKMLARNVVSTQRVFAALKQTEGISSGTKFVADRVKIGELTDDSIIKDFTKVFSKASILAGRVKEKLGIEAVDENKGIGKDKSRKMDVQR